MVDEPIVSTKVDPPDTMLVTMTAVEMATSPPLPPPVAEPLMLSQS